MPTKIQVRRGTASEWTTANPTLSAGEIGFESDTSKFKIGNGTSNWSALGYLDPSASPVQSVNTKTGTVSLTTTDIGEGTNLYYTNARFDDRVSSVKINNLNNVQTSGEPVDGAVFKWSVANNRWEDGLASAPLYFVENVRTANYTLVLSDVAKVVAFDSASNLTLTVPLNSSVAFPIGSVVNVYRAGAGEVAVAGASGVTVRNEGSIQDQHAEVSLRKRGTDEWVLAGRVA
jgi:hypothetical protein